MEKEEFISECCIGEKCFCGKDAVKKAEEVIFDDDPNPYRHPYTSYICLEHFNMIFRPYLKKEKI